MSDTATTHTHDILLFDGECNLCNRWVDFVIRHDRRDRFRVGTLQTSTRVLQGMALQDSIRRAQAAALPDSVVLLQEGQVYVESDAALRVLTGLGGWCALAGVFKIVPRALRDAVYRWVARNRFRWFGRRATCRVPSPTERAKFLDD